MFRAGGYRELFGYFNLPIFSARSGKFQRFASMQSGIHIIPEYTPLSHQGTLGSCVGNAVADSFEILKGLEDPSRVEQVSRLFIYYNARVYIQETNKDAGSHISHALDSMTKLGACRESTWPYDPNKVLMQPPLEAYREANDNTLTYFYQITSTGDERLIDVEAAIRANHPVIFGTRIGSEFQNFFGGEKVFGIPSDDVGGHAMVITGVRVNAQGKKEFYIRNSWGDRWGNGGHAWFSSEYIAWNSTHELFVPTRMIDFLV
jgi:C1A family cysteine protease